MVATLRTLTSEACGKRRPPGYSGRASLRTLSRAGSTFCPGTCVSFSATRTGCSGRRGRLARHQRAALVRQHWRGTRGDPQHLRTTRLTYDRPDHTSVGRGQDHLSRRSRATSKVTIDNGTSTPRRKTRTWPRILHRLRPGQHRRLLRRDPARAQGLVGRPTEVAAGHRRSPRRRTHPAGQPLLHRLLLPGWIRRTSAWRRRGSSPGRSRPNERGEGRSGQTCAPVGWSTRPSERSRRRRRRQ